MDFLKRNSGKIALLAIIAFFTLPFIYGNEEEEDFSPFAVRSGMSYQSNPISKLANKIASFYGFSKPASATVASSKGVDTIKEKVAGNRAFGKEDSPDFQPATESKNEAKEQYEALVASSRNFKSSGTGTSRSSFDNQNGNAGNNYSTNYQTNYYGNGASGSINGGTGTSTSTSNSPVKGYVTVNGQNYEVIEDIKGNRYVVTPKGHIPYEEVMRKMVSDKEFAAAKKRLVGASDMEVLAAIQQEKERQAYQANGGKYQAGVNGYRNGNLTNVGGTNYARVSTSDKGFDDEILSNAYEDLKNINVKIDNGGSSLSSGSSRGGNSYNSFVGGDNSSNLSYEQRENQNNPGLISSGITRKVQDQVSSQVIRQGNTQPIAANETELEDDSDQALLENNKEQARALIKQEGKITADISSNQVLAIQRNEEDDTYTSLEEGIAKEGDIFIETKENNVWGIPSQISIDGYNRSGVSLPIQYTQKNGLLYSAPKKSSKMADIVANNAQHIEQNVKMMNDSLNNIKAEGRKLEDLENEVKIFISDSDKISLYIVKDVLEGTNIKIVDNKDEDVIIINESLVFTPQSFDTFATNIKELVRQIPQAGNEPA